VPHGIAGLVPVQHAVIEIEGHASGGQDTRTEQSVKLRDVMRRAVNHGDRQVRGTPVSDAHFPRVEGTHGGRVGDTGDVRAGLRCFFRQAFQVLSVRQQEKLAGLGYAYAVSGNRDEALRVLDEIKSNPRQQYVSPFHVAMRYAGLGEKDEAMRWLQKAYAQRDEWMVYLKIYPEFAALHDDRRFQEIERRVGLS
jgi:hypothetical protein